MTVRFNISGPMISGQHDAVIRVYKKIPSKKEGYFYFVANQENEADNIYCGYEADKGHPHSDGMGGATMEVECVDGSVVKIQGPWHTNPGDLLVNTGYDCRDKSFTRGIIARERTLVKGSWEYDYDKVIHYDEKATLGEYSRIEKMAQAHTDATGEVVFYAFVSRGGGSAGSTRLPAKPNVKTPVSSGPGNE